MSDIQGDIWVIWVTIPAQFPIFSRDKPLPGAPVGPFMEKTPVFWVQKDRLELRN